MANDLGRKRVTRPEDFDADYSSATTMVDRIYAELQKTLQLEETVKEGGEGDEKDVDEAGAESGEKGEAKVEEAKTEDCDLDALD